jgi:hypothetical protein
MQQTSNSSRYQDLRLQETPARSSSSSCSFIYKTVLVFLQAQMQMAMKQKLQQQQQLLQPQPQSVPVLVGCPSLLQPTSLQRWSQRPPLQLQKRSRALSCITHVQRILCTMSSNILQAAAPTAAAGCLSIKAAAVTLQETCSSKKDSRDSCSNNCSPALLGQTCLSRARHCSRCSSC